MLLSIKPSLAVPQKISKNFLRLNDQLGSGLQLFINRDDLNHDLVEGDYKLRIFFDGRSLLKDGENYPKNIKVEVYTNTGGDKELLTILNRTVKNQKAAKNVLLITKLPRLDNTVDLYFDIFDTNNILDASFVQNITITNSTGATASSQTNVPDFTCASDDGECLIEYILRNVTFSANFDRHLKTEVFKNDKGRYTVNLPVKKGRKLGKKVRKFNAKGGGKGGNTTNNNFDLGTYPFFEDEVETGRLFWDSINQAIKFNFGNNGNLFSFNKDGSLELGPNLVFEQGSLLTSPQDGAVEYDGNNLYFTTGSTRSLIYTSGNSNLVDLSNGGFLNGNITFIGSSMINDAVFNGSFQYKTGAGTGLVLTSDANGNASWQAAATGADNLGNHIANQGLTMSGFSITNIDQVNGNTANFNDLNITNNGFYTAGSQLKINGDLFIPTGAANGYVLASDANGFATWVSAASLSGTGDNLGNHNALQRIDMGGFTLRNADQVNGNTANFTDTNTTNITSTGFALFNGSSNLQINGSLAIKPGATAGYVLSSDINGLASWQSLSSLINGGSAALSSGIAGAIQLADGSGGFNSDANNFYVDTINGYAIIGNATNFVTAIGEDAASSMVTTNSLNVNAIGYQAAMNNNGNTVHAIGYQSAMNNNGDTVNAIGDATAQNNTGDFVNAFGSSTAQSNRGNHVNAIGVFTAQNNTGNNVSATGFSAHKIIPVII